MAYMLQDLNHWGLITELGRDMNQSRLAKIANWPPVFHAVKFIAVNGRTTVEIFTKTQWLRVPSRIAYAIAIVVGTPVVLVIRLLCVPPYLALNAVYLRRLELVSTRGKLRFIDRAEFQCICCDNPEGVWWLDACRVCEDVGCNERVSYCGAQSE